MSNENNKPWLSAKEGYRQAVDYMTGRMKGDIQSVITPWSNINNATVNGLEWNTTVVICARPSVGKTLVKDQFVREIDIHNPDLEYRVLEFNLEMPVRTAAMREFTAITGKSYKELCSADEVLAKATLHACIEYGKQQLTKDSAPDTVETAPDCKTFESIVRQYFYENRREDGSYIPTIVTVDHIGLVNAEPTDFFTVLTRLRKQLPVMFVALAQLNRNCESQERIKNGSQGNYLLTSDIYGSDAIQQHADVLIAYNRPSMYNINLYGPTKYIISEWNTIVAHILKVRSGEQCMTFFKGLYETMQFVAIEPPPQKKSIEI